MSMPAYQYVLAVFGLLSSFLNGAVIVAILKFRKSNSHLQGSYFMLVIFHASADILLALEFATLMRGRKYGHLNFILDEGSSLWVVLPRVTSVLHYYLKAVIYNGHILLSFNRFTSAFFPLNYESFWRSKRMLFVRITAWLLPWCFVLPVVLNSNRRMWYARSAPDMIRLESDGATTQILSLIDGSFTFIATVICIVFYALSAFRISRRMMKYGLQQKLSVEIRLFVSSFFFFSLLALNTVSQVWTIVAAVQKKDDVVMLLNDLSYPLLDALYSANPWILFATSSTIRSALFGLPLPAKCFKDTTIRVGSSCSVRFAK